ncbi:sulfatase-like hydrolase/transferase [Hyphomicrobium sp.]|uniref:sulfatase-like hydrolase/transferase n=1 Tax=Hyphomicrobium sp. TaxID=82 RepID=UPI002B52C9E0|nr:sulfatase-like hydrolase/transferase [Hyphomicrobium sp.]HVZ03120.1 sulfatase-like hydrolase/transferase [Hyphomicrobium sp.]
MKNLIFARTALKVIAISAILFAAPLLWLDLVQDTLHPMGSLPPHYILNEYFLAYALTIASIAIVPFLRTTSIRIALTFLILAAVAFDQAVLFLSGSHVNQELVNLLWQVRDNTSDGLSFLPTVFWHILWLLPVGFIFCLRPGRWSLPLSFALVPAGAFVVTFHNVQIGDYQKVIQPPVFAIEGQIVKAMRMADPKTRPPNAVGYVGPIAPRIKKILYIVDESVGGTFMSLNNPQFDNTPFLTSLVGKDFFFNFGAASSIANCSTATRLMLRVGLREAMLPDKRKASLKSPNFWLYARRAGYRTYYFDAFRTAFTFHSYMGRAEAAQIDERIPLAKVGDDQFRDHDIAHRLLKLLDKSESQFIFVEKEGAHYPHTGWVLPQGFSYNPVGVDAYSDPLGLNSAQKAQVSNYLKEINWQVDDFFKVLRPALDRPDTVVIYTSDHGQNMFAVPSRYFHCNPKNPAITEGEVPLFVSTGDPGIKKDLKATLQEHVDHSSHFEIFPTLLDWMGYDRRFVVARYGLELYGPPPVGVRKFLGQNAFVGKWFGISANPAGRSTRDAMIAPRLANHSDKSPDDHLTKYRP